MVFKLIYSTVGGTTKKTTQILEEIINNDDNEVECINIGLDPYRENYGLIIDKIKNADIVGFGSPAYHMNMFEPMLKLLEAIAYKNQSNKMKFKSFFYLNYGGITSGKAFLKNARLLNNNHIGVIGALKISAPHFYKNEYFPDEKIIKLIEEFYIKLKNKEFKEYNIDKLEKAFKPKIKRMNLIFPFAHFIGNRRALRIEINQENCKKCGKCQKECPVKAIDLNECINIDDKKCIHCYHCVVACNFNALNIDERRLEKMIIINKKILGSEKPANEII